MANPIKHKVLVFVRRAGVLRPTMASKPKPRLKYGCYWQQSLAPPGR
jgi:hypothetical protein